MYDLGDLLYFDDAAIDAELRRVFDVCHTCRMCFNYCPSFPSLFGAIDRHEEAGRGEVGALTTVEMNEVVDLCYQCKLCYVKCPYTPPHKFAVDLPRLLFRAKLARVRKSGVGFRERVLGDPDRLGRLSTGAMSRFVNWANAQPLLRVVAEKALGIHRKRLLPRFARTTFTKWFARQKHAGGEPVVLFETCTVNYNRPEVGVAAVQVLEHNGKRIERPDVVCCGMPALDGGDVEAARE
ncbi:MAG TPA: 4Fe-4S dicluster domain-containing protein, partial [Thermoanaerobaculia bacterium]|nr:4Fe-4S dicluster domain-containing protein [Thermoanaerobaculia bacterium]